MRVRRCIVLLGISLLLVSCGGKDYSSNQFIRESTTYFQVLHAGNYFLFRKDGTGQWNADGNSFDLTFTLKGDSSVEMEYGGTKMGVGTFSVSATSGKYNFTWNGKTYTTL